MEASTILSIHNRADGLTYNAGYSLSSTYSTFLTLRAYFTSLLTLPTYLSDITKVVVTPTPCPAHPITSPVFTSFFL